MFKLDRRVLGLDISISVDAVVSAGFRIRTGVAGPHVDRILRGGLDDAFGRGAQLC